MKFAHVIDVPQRVVVEDGDVAARHVGDVDVVPLVVQGRTASRPSKSRRRPGCGLKTMIFCRSVAAGLRANPAEQVVEHPLPDGFGRPAFAKQIVQPMLDEIAGSSLSSGFLILRLSQITARFSSRRIPADRADEPGRLDGRQLGGRRQVEGEGHVAVRLQKTGGDFFADRLFDAPGGRSAPCARPAR